jgi:cytoskeleton protein RodZ
MSQSLPNEHDLHYTDMSVGEILRRTRVHYGQSLEDIERALRIKASQIDAIESGNVEQLPGRVYAIGFVRSYAEYLGLDGEKMVDLFKSQSAGKTVKPALDFPVAASESKTPPIWMMFLSLVISVCIVIGILSFQDRDRTLVTDVPNVSEYFTVDDDASDSVQTPSVEVFTTDVASGGVDEVPLTIEEATQLETDITQEESPEPDPAQQGILLNMVQNSWVEIKDQSGRAVVSRVLKAGEQYYVPDRPDLTMSLGNAGGVQLTVDGQELVPLGRQGQVRRNISLNAKFLKQSYAKPVEAQTQNALENIQE